MQRCITIIFFVLFTVVNSYAQSLKQDLFQEVISEMGLNTSELGIQPKGHWSRYPHNVSYLSPAFEDLYANPIKLYDLSRLMASKVEQFLNPDSLLKNENKVSGLFYSIGYSNQLSGFRGFPVAFGSKTSETLEAALFEFFNSTRKIGQSNIRLKKSDLRDFLLLPSWLHQPLKHLIQRLSMASEYHAIAMRNVRQENARHLFNQSNYLNIQDGNSKNYYLYADLMTQIDEQSLAYSSMIVFSACEAFCADVDTLYSINTESEFEYQLQTPIGEIIIADGRQQNHNKLESPLLIVDFGGNDTYKGSVASTSFNHPFSILIDFAGNDEYTGSLNDHCTQGAGILGTGILIDRQGTDKYSAANYAQGFGLFGTGVLLDNEGDDTYKMQNSGQGCGYFGLGMNIDISGNDGYYIYGDGQGMAGVHGTGILCNYSGKDKYLAEVYPDSSSTRADYHSQGQVNANFAQGAAQGRRGDLTDGHSMASGFGILFDMKGDDTYQAGNFSQGIGYWFGIGVLFDNDGHDTYNSVYFTQASAAHFAMGALIDRGGNDSHILSLTSGAGLAFGWDFCNALFVDEAGDDTYEVQQFSIGNSMIRSNTYFIDYKGDDTYRTAAKNEFFGVCDHQNYYESPPVSLLYYESKQVSCFIDADGNDNYLEGNAKNGWNKGSRILNNSRWSANNSSKDFNNFQIGVDESHGVIQWIEKWNRPNE